MKMASGVERTFLRSMALTVSGASLVLASAEESFWPSGLTPLVVLIAHFVVDRWKRFRLTVRWANVSGVVAFVAMAVEFREGDLLGKLLSGAHLLVYMTWVVLLLQKGIRQFWWLAALSVLQVSVASVLTNNPSFGASLTVMLLLMIWTLAVFTLFRAQLRLSESSETVEDSLNADDRHGPAESGISVRHGLQLDSDEPWIGWRFRGITGFTFIASLLVGIVAFAVFPRFWVRETLGALPSVTRGLVHQTGFTETVQLGEIGQIMKSDQRVLQFEITRIDNGAAVAPDELAQALKLDELCFRGNALGRYYGGRWSSGSSQARSVGDLELRRPFETDPRRSDFRIRITQDPPIATFAFAPMPANNVVQREARGEVAMRRLSYSLIHRVRQEKHRSEPLTYEVWCAAAPPAQQRHSPRPLRPGVQDLFSRAFQAARRAELEDARAWCLTRGIQAALPDLSRVAAELCTDDGQRVSDRDCVDRVDRYLAASGRFSYSLTATIEDASRDPIEDFLINRRTGHCEYFASAAALMLQAVGVPARVVNGYKGCEINSVTGRWEVKQKHAHTWVEAYVGRQWETLDPTPAAARDEGVSQPRHFEWWKDLRAAMGDGWFQMVQKMSLQQQEAFVRPWLDFFSELFQTIREQGLWASLKMFCQEVILQPRKWVSWQTGVVTFVLLLIPGIVLQRRPDRALAELFRRLLHWLRPLDRQQRTVVRFYENFCGLCARHGLTFPNHQTAQENARLAVQHFYPRLPTDQDQSLPRRIADAFNMVRFGDVVMSPEDIAAVRSDVKRFGEILAQHAQ
ncbi:MAG: DUF3488 and transglutaminase-like domain-containing protein [Fuerstiella sp.]